MTEKIEKTEQEWRAELSPEPGRLREHGTERAFTGAYHDTKEPGVYRCAGCGTELFTSQTKYDSGTGWPSFYEPVDGEAVETERDWILDRAPHRGALLLVRRAPRARFLGRAPADGPPLLHNTRPRSSSSKGRRSDGEGDVRRRLLLGRRGGLPQHAWCQGRRRRLHGRRRSGLDLRAGLLRPDAEVVQVEFDPDEASYETLLGDVLERHNPTRLNRGPDVGRQYRSVVFFHSPGAAGRAARPRRPGSRPVRGPGGDRGRAGEGVPRAEEYHQQYLVKHGRAVRAT